MYKLGDFDVIVVGAGHAGIEAALAAARLNVKVGIFTINLDAIGNMPCNPSVGGTAKGHLVFEIDALGGEMAKAADATFLQSRMLNVSKGPAVHSLRVQSDRRAYARYMKNALESCPGLTLIQSEITDILFKDNKVTGVVTHLGAMYGAKAVVIAGGTYLRSKIIVGDSSFDSGPDGMFAASRLSSSLERAGIQLRRFKTGTPPRINKKSINLEILEKQQGDDEITPFSFETKEGTGENKVLCYLTHTNERTHQIIRDNIHLAPLYSGKIKGVGARYCPSIEDKVMRFSDKPAHQLFIEPCGLNTQEMYIQGLSSSLPEQVQHAFIRTIKGLENAEIMRCAYAIEYDCIDPTILTSTLEFKKLNGLFSAGQLSGTSGYEEAAAQGLIAGINAALKIKGAPPYAPTRADSYIGALIDDLVTKGTPEPYRMMTSRSEYRLILRQDNADLRLSEQGYKIGLISQSRYDKFLKKKNLIEVETKRLYNTFVLPNNPHLCRLLHQKQMPMTKNKTSLAALIGRPQISYAELAPCDPLRKALPKSVWRQAEISIKYKGYIDKQLAAVKEFSRLENKLIPPDIDYLSMHGLRIEARQKLDSMRPESIGKASRISGVSPADISVLLIHLSQHTKQKE